MDGAGFRGRGGRAAAAGRGRHPVVVRRSRRGVRGREARARRDVRDRGSRPPLDGAAQRLAYWQNGKCFLHGSTQSQSFPIPASRASAASSPPIVYVSEFCGGGFGSKGGAYPLMAIPALMSKKIGRPVMMRVSRHEVLHGLGACRVPRPRQDRLRGRRPRAGRRPLYSAGERPERASTTSSPRRRPSRSSISQGPCVSAACPCSRIRRRAARSAVPARIRSPRRSSR